MAEAAVEDRPPQRFYCHMCHVQFQHASADFTCPHCSDGFIEELLEAPEGNEEMADVDDWEEDDWLVEDRRPGSRPLRSDGSRPGRRYANTRARIVRPRTLTRLASSNLRQQLPLENLLQDFIVNLGVGVNWGTPGGNWQLFLGNPGDYAWGREGLDAIVTQLLNQMDSTGPPPVSKAVIDALPIVEITLEQSIAKLQCSVCWEDFLTGESVRRLPCQHVYHEPCIRPWLELHGTCPICRQNLSNGDSDDRRGDGSEGSAGGGGSQGEGTAGGPAVGAPLSLSMLRTLFPPPHTPPSSGSGGSASSSGTAMETNDSEDPPSQHQRQLSLSRSRFQSNSSMMLGILTDVSVPVTASGGRLISVYLI
ncbi:unnamed protein product [Acanthoscelides obtectus]|uniref:RING-type E3 ubiquitin transferase n=1 Tax=Acanthoscelides obtectus TaxID=200917 RepID=A0A9P0LR06_ACAOB|nr:unnamed protein product [Acanthoscelides obtectus]CAK1635331.1 E3 ubiquitin-protein ligase RNF115 [Acanthoscelides obtectus]